MRLFDPQRPQINFRPALASGTSVIPRIDIWPSSRPGRVVLGAMLPLADDPFLFSLFETEIDVSGVEWIMEEFVADPEGTLEELFGGRSDRPEINLRRERKLSSRRQIIRTSLESLGL